MTPLILRSRLSQLQQAWLAVLHLLVLCLFAEPMSTHRLVVLTLVELYHPILPHRLLPLQPTSLLAAFPATLYALPWSFRFVLAWIQLSGRLAAAPADLV